MIISPLPSTANVAPEAKGAFDHVKSIKMRTQVSRTEGMPLAQNDPVDDNKDKLESDIEDTQPISPQFARLAKERRALQVRQRELEAREKALESSPAQSDGIPLARLKQEPLKVLLEAGVTYDELADAVLNSQGNPEFASLKSEMAALKEGVDNKFKENADQQEQSVLAEMSKEATALAATGEDYELIREMKQVPRVMELITKTYKQTGEVLDVAKAMGLIESALEKRAEKIASLTKIRSKYQPQPAPMPARQQGMRTLTNRDTAAPPMTPKQRALAAFYGQLPR